MVGRACLLRQFVDQAPRFAPLRDWLARAPVAVLSAYAVVAGFSTYFCMYAFRKPFAAAQFEGQRFIDGELDLKTAMVIGQIVGYAVSKYAGVKFVSEVRSFQRAKRLVALVAAAHLALVLFALVPGDLKVVAIFFNGLPLGMVWGLVVRYLEGRRTSEILLAGLCVSFIVASGVVKDVGRWLMAEHHISETWMPALTGLLFLAPFLFSVWALHQLPEPNAEDIAARTERKPMNAAQRAAFIREFFWGLLMLVTVYFFVTAFRDYRDNYGVELFAELGYAEQPAVFSRTEVPVALGVLVALGLLNLIKDNRRGLVGAFVVMGLGCITMAGGTALLDAGLVDGLTWMVLVGLGSYFIYVPYNSVLFDRLIAATGTTATAVFAIYVADALGYTGSVGIQIYKDILGSDMSRLNFFRGFTYALSAGGLTLLAASLVYFLRSAKPVGETERAA